MPRLACWKCGRQLYTVAPLEELFAEERRCPRCGAFLRAERRENERRQHNRRVNPRNDPGPPKPPKAGSPPAKNKAGEDPPASTEARAPADPGGERRTVERRATRRRRDWNEHPRPGSGSGGWQD
jgi:ribosomal protein S27AE